jgi:multimeric flavodoxin WrbA
MKKILGVIGSPRKKGNTDLLVSAILAAAKEAGAEVEKIRLGDLRIQECDGCHTCWQGKPCSKRDGMNRLYPKIIASDVIIFGTPVYWFGPSALIKAFLDRFVYFNGPQTRNLIQGKAAVLAAPFEDTTLATAAPLVAMFEKSLDYLEMNLVATLLVPGVGERGEILKKKSKLKQAGELGKRLALDKGRAGR